MSSKGPDTEGASRIQADASRYSADLQARSEAENRALQTQLFDRQMGYMQEQDVYNKGITKQNQENYNPYITAGQGGLSQLSGAVSDPNSWLNKSFSQADMQNDDGYQFRLDQGQSALNNSLAAKGGLLSGAALKASAGYNQGMASEEYANAFSRFNTEKAMRYDSLNGLANMGLQGANGFAGGSPQSVSGSQMAQVSNNYGQTMGSIMQNGADNQTAIAMANANAQAQMKLTPGRSAGAGFLSGAASGASAGAMFGPMGAGIGGVLGGLSSLL